MRVFVLLLAFVTVTFDGVSQTSSLFNRKNMVHIEVGGIGGFGSINYERVIPLKNKFAVSGRIGLSTIRVYDFTTQFNPDLLLPLSINGFYGESHKIQVGFGQIIANSLTSNFATGEPQRETNFHTNFTLGYRYQKAESRFVYGISYSPILTFQKTYQHWGGIMFGYLF